MPPVSRDEAEESFGCSLCRVKLCKTCCIIVINAFTVYACTGMTMYDCVLYDIDSIYVCMHLFCVSFHHLNSFCNIYNDSNIIQHMHTCAEFSPFGLKSL